MSEDNHNQIPKEDPGRTFSPTPATTEGGGAGGGTGVRKIISGIVSVIGFVKGKPVEQGTQTGDVATRLAHQRTDLAMERNYLAADRTLMAWIRTALSMISFGFTIGKLGQVLHEVNVKGVLGRTRTMSIENIAYFLVILGTVALLMAAIQHWFRMRDLYKLGLRHQVSISFVVALLLIAVGGFALSSLILAL
jgi:putative membrane protein